MGLLMSKSHGQGRCARSKAGAATRETQAGCAVAAERTRGDGYGWHDRVELPGGTATNDPYEKGRLRGAEADTTGGARVQRRAHTVCGAVRDHPPHDLRQAPRAVEDGICAVEPGSRHATDRARVWRRAGGSYGGDYLRCWGFTPQKPIKRTYEQRPEAVKAWIEQQFPDIEKRVKAEGSESYWGGETALVNTNVRGRSHAPKGKTHVTMAAGGTR